MAKITLKGTPANTFADLPKLQDKAPDFQLTQNNLSEVTLDDYKDYNLILNIFPSVDTETCAASVRAFNEKSAKLADTKVLCISADLPFAQSRFCSAEGIKNVETLSSFRDSNFGKDYGLEMIDSPLKGLLARAIVVINKKGEVLHSELVSEIVNEPNYEKALSSLN